MIVYLVVNKLNGKQYVGQTTTSLSLRWTRHCVPSAKYCRLLHKAITKYGRDNFEVSTIDVASSKEELDAKEIYHIRRLGTLNPDGYNLLSGGSFGRHSEDTKRKMSETRTGRKVPALSKPRGPCPPERRIKISLAKKGNNGLLGKKRAYIEKPNTRVKVFGLSLDDCSRIDFDSIKQASEFFGKSHSNIVATINGRKNSAYGYKWFYNK